MDSKQKPAPGKQDLGETASRVPVLYLKEGSFSCSKHVSHAAPDEAMPCNSMANCHLPRAFAVLCADLEGKCSQG